MGHTALCVCVCCCVVYYHNNSLENVCYALLEFSMSLSEVSRIPRLVITNSDDSLHAGQIAEIFSLNGIQDLATRTYSCIHIIKI